jgi:hypothetical protein
VKPLFSETPLQGHHRRHLVGITAVGLKGTRCALQGKWLFAKDPVWCIKGSWFLKNPIQSCETFPRQRLVVQLASAELSEVQRKELDGLENARARFEDTRTAEEIIAEFQTRERYAKLLSSLKSASMDKL